MLELDAQDQALLNGDFGPAAARAMALLVRYGEAVQAERFISITSAHIDGCLYHGPSSIDFVKRFVDLGGGVRVPTTLNVAAVDVTHPERHAGPPYLIAAQTELTRLHEDLGCTASLTCAPYHRLIRPHLGDHVAWAESNAIVFANSVLGARTDRYGDFTDLCAALTGRAPLCGLHKDENRRPTLVLEAPSLEHSGLTRDLYFAAIGYAAGEASEGGVPLIEGLPLDTNEDEFKTLGAAGASSGSLALFHAADLTPEAEQAQIYVAAAAIPHRFLAEDRLRQIIDNLCPLALGEQVCAICLGTPHFSINEFRALARRVNGRTRAKNVAVYVSTSRETAAQLQNAPEFSPLWTFGVEIVVDTCTYVNALKLPGEGAIVTNSAKYAHYGPGNLKRRIGLMSLDRCLASAVAGHVMP